MLQRHCFRIREMSESESPSLSANFDSVCSLSSAAFANILIHSRIPRRRVDHTPNRCVSTLTTHKRITGFDSDECATIVMNATVHCKAASTRALVGPSPQTKSDQNIIFAKNEGSRSGIQPTRLVEGLAEMLKAIVGAAMLLFCGMSEVFDALRTPGTFEFPKARKGKQSRATILSFLGILIRGSITKRIQRSQ